MHESAGGGGQQSMHRLKSSTHLPTDLVLPFLRSEEEAQVVPQRQPGVDPEQLAVLAEQFDAQDEDGDGGCFG